MGGQGRPSWKSRPPGSRPSSSRIASNRRHSSPPQRPQGPYQRLVGDLSYRYPVLNYLNEFFNKQPVYLAQVSVLEFEEDRVIRINFNHGDGASHEKLRQYLDSPPRCQHRLFLLEDLDPDIIEVLGASLNIDGTILAHQIRATHWAGGGYNGDTPDLPSSIFSPNGFTLRYYESRFLDEWRLPRLSAEMCTLGNIQRQVSLGVPFEIDWKKSWAFVGHIRRNTSFWSHKYTDGSWNGIILVDAPISTRKNKPNFKFDDSEKPEYVENRLYQKGYRDFTPWPATTTAESSKWAPRRESFLEDIAYYWTVVATPSQIASAIASPFESATFQLKITASVWMNTLTHIHSVLSLRETDLWLIAKMIQPHLSNQDRDDYLERFTEGLNDMNTLRRRLTWYILEMENNLLALDISLTSPSPTPTSYEKDFLYIHQRLVSYQAWAEKLMNIINGHVNLMETEKAISDSNSLSRLTILGFFFIPMGFVSALFSMGGDYAVGGNRFWIFWVVAVVVVGGCCSVGFWKYWKIRWERRRKEKRH